MTASAYYDSPVGWLMLESVDDAITGVRFMDEPDEIPVISSPFIQQCIDELNAYFSGRLEKFTVPLNPGGTSFQTKVWQQLRSIPFGKTMSYAQLAQKLGDLKSVRAVGTANGRNPVAIIIPCHRVIGSDGSLIGYGGGLWRKKWLLDFEHKRKQGELFE